MRISRIDERILGGIFCSACMVLLYIAYQLVQSSWLSGNSDNAHYLKILLLIECCVIVLYVLWVLECLPIYIKCYIALTAALLLTPILFAGISLKTTIELRHPVGHIREDAEFVIRLTQCFVQETRLAINASRQAFLEERHIQSVYQGITSLKKIFDSLSQSAEEFRQLIGSSLTWLDQRGISCDVMASAPYRNCITVCLEARKNCSTQLVAGAAFFCDITKVCDAFCNTVKGLAKGACNNMVQNALTNLDRYKMTLKEATIQHTSLRAAFQFSLNVTSNVRDHYVSRWENLKESLDQQTKSVTAVMQVVLQVLQIAVPCIIVIYPIWYALLFRYGSNNFQNNFIDPDLENQERTPLFPLTPNEALEYQLMDRWTPTCTQLRPIIRRYLATTILIGIVLSLDWTCTCVVSRLHRYLSQILESVGGKIFHFQRVPKPEGMAQIVDIFTELLDKIQTAADFGRTRHCLIETPPTINYSHYPFVLATSLLLILFWIAKQCNLPAMVCARFDENRHLERHYYIRNKILMQRAEND